MTNKRFNSKSQAVVADASMSWGSYLFPLTALAIGVATYLAMNWGAMPFLQRMVGLLFVAMILHGATR